MCLGSLGIHFHKSSIFVHPLVNPHILTLGEVAQHLRSTKGWRRSSNETKPIWWTTSSSNPVTSLVNLHCFRASCQSYFLLLPSLFLILITCVRVRACVGDWSTPKTVKHLLLVHVVLWLQKKCQSYNHISARLSEPTSTFTRMRLRSLGFQFHKISIFVHSSVNPHILTLCEAA